jgi:hypothetical protein
MITVSASTENKLDASISPEIEPQLRATITAEELQAVEMLQDIFERWEIIGLDRRPAIEAIHEFAKALMLDGRYLECLPDNTDAVAVAMGVELPPVVSEWLKVADKKAVASLLRQMATYSYEMSQGPTCAAGVIIVLVDIGIGIVYWVCGEYESVVEDYSEEAALKL